MTKALIKLLKPVFILVVILLGVILTKGFANILFIVLGISFALFYGRDVIDGALTIITLTKK